MQGTPRKRKIENMHYKNKSTHPGLYTNSNPYLIRYVDSSYLIPLCRPVCSPTSYFPRTSNIAFFSVFFL